jgi:hypothetical protein
MVPTAFWSLPQVQLAGYDAGIAVFTLLLDAGQRGSDEVLPPECVNARRLAIATGLAARDGLKAAIDTMSAAIDDAFSSGLLIRRDDGGIWFCEGVWVERDDVRRKLRADKVRTKRTKAADDADTMCAQREHDPTETEHSAGKDAHDVPERAHDVRQRERDRGRDTPRPPTGGAVEAPVEATDDKGRPLHHPERVAEVTAVAFASTPDESQRIADAGHRLMAALGLSMADTVRRSSPASKVLDIIGREPVEVIEELARATEQQTGGIRAPVAWIDNALPGARVEAERQAALDRHIAHRRAISDQRKRESDAEHERAQRILADPEQMARTSAMFRQALADLDAEAAQ